MTAAAEALIRTLCDGSTADRMAAAGALAALGQAALPPLLSLLDDPDPRLRMWAAYTLGMIGDAGAVPALVQALKDADPAVVKWAAAALCRIRDGGCGCRFC
ncbi:MAG: HEAT repeat domain-containing protein [Methanomicrobiales archaeon]|nr:HEAT repeat domain-containing protein [Methanomicrobiales archaeon]